MVHAGEVMGIARLKKARSTHPTKNFNLWEDATMAITVVPVTQPSPPRSAMSEVAPVV